MAKHTLQLEPVFTVSPASLDFSAVKGFKLRNLVSVVNLTRGCFLYCPAIGLTYSGTPTGSEESPKSVFNLTVDTTGHDPEDELACNYDGGGIGNNHRFTDGFADGVDTAIWDYTAPGGEGLVVGGGNTAGSQYLRMVMPTVMAAGTELTLLSKRTFQFPSRFSFAVSQSQRVAGQELEISLVACNDDGTIPVATAPADCTISGSITVASNVATINFTAKHTFKGGERVMVCECQNSRLNVGPVVVTPTLPDQVTVPLTLANGTYTVGGTGMVRHIDPLQWAKNGAGILIENTTATNATSISRRNSGSPRMVNTTIATTVALQTNASPYSDSFNSANIFELFASAQEALLVSRTADGVSSSGGSNKFTQGIPDEGLNYKLRIRARDLKVRSRIITNIVSISKTGTTTATVVCDAGGHGLTGDEFVAISGVLDITNFPVHGGIAMVGLSGLSVQSVSCLIAGILTVTVNTTATGALPGEYWKLHGTGSGTYDGIYKVLKMTGSTYELEKTTATLFGAVNTGGTLSKMTEHRLHFLTELDYSRQVVELTNQHGVTDAARALPVNVTGLPTLSTVTTVTTVSALTNMVSIGGVAANSFIYDTQRNAWANAIRPRIAA